MYFIWIADIIYNNFGGSVNKICTVWLSYAVPKVNIFVKIDENMYKTEINLY